MLIDYTNKKCFMDFMKMLQYRGWVSDNEIKIANKMFEDSSDKTFIRNIPSGATKFGGFSEVLVIICI